MFMFRVSIVKYVPEKAIVGGVPAKVIKIIV